jgi:hypothetical protein
MRGVFVSSLKLSAFHAGFTWLTLRAFDAHFVCLATAASAVVAVLPLVPVALVAAPAALELALLRGAPVKGLVLAALHLGAYYFGDDLIFREVRAFGCALSEVCSVAKYYGGYVSSATGLFCAAVAIVGTASQCGSACCA